jgi:hypothetical protein
LEWFVKGPLTKVQKYSAYLSSSLRSNAASPQDALRGCCMAPGLLGELSEAVS